MTAEYVPFLLVTANVGSVFEDPTRLLKSWMNEFLSKIAKVKPQFIALHLQEVGGKTYEKSLEYVQEFIQILCESHELSDFNRIRIYLDEDFTSAEHFTALGNLYFIAKSIDTVCIWNFLTHEWETVEGKSIHTGNIEAVATKEKAKFPQHFFPECKWSRKGFLRTRWNISGTVMDMVNIHLFHDASNLVASEEYPSMYCKSRRRALVHTLERFHEDTKNGLAPYFVFGDFNFRCDTEGVVRKLTEDLSIHRILNLKNDHYKVQYRNTDGCNVLTIGKKEFYHSDHQKTFKDEWLQQFDRELQSLKDVLIEYPITFPPSYPYEEEPTLPKDYMLTRCPAWCDRILMSPTARSLIVEPADVESSTYDTIGVDTCMGDHKPIYLSVKIKVQQGIIRCCNQHVNNIAPGQQLLLNDQTSALVAANSTDICLYSSKEFCDILLECRKLDSQSLYTNAATSNTASLATVSNPSSHPARFPHQTSPVVATDDGNGDVAPNSDAHATATAIGTISNTKNRVTPTVSINVTDTDNLSVCMCSLLYASTDTILIEQDPMGKSSICPRCRNIIERQSSEPRRTLITKRLTLANDIIVNRVDTHYLNLNPYQCGRQYDPYTPETIESHSPATDIDDIHTSDDIDDIDHDGHLACEQCDADADDDPDTALVKRASTLPATIGRSGVSPGQLKARLERLRHYAPDTSTSNSASTASDSSMIVKQSSCGDELRMKVVKDGSSSKCCASRYCVIL